jgi:hypothetical protein
LLSVIDVRKSPTSAIASVTEPVNQATAYREQPCVTEYGTWSSLAARFLVALTASRQPDAAPVSPEAHSDRWILTQAQAAVEFISEVAEPLPSIGLHTHNRAWHGSLKTGTSDSLELFVV